MEYELLWKFVTYIYYVGGLLLILKVYNTVTAGVCKTDKRLDGQVIIVTGSNTGIGKAAALDFAKRGAKVILACRDLVKAHKAKDEIVEITNNKNVVVRHLDLSSLKSVRQFASEIIATENRLDVLVNNAGLGGMVDKKTEDGLEWALQVNHYGHFLLTNLLIDLLKKSAPSRIIHVSSMMHRMGRLDFDNMNFEKGVNGFMIYNVSKLYNIIGSNEFAKRLEGTGVTSNSLHPGIVHTEIFREVPFLIRKFVNKMLQLFFKSPEEGAQTTIYLAVNDEVTNVSGKYFSDCQEAYSSSITRDKEAGKKFWDKCCDFVHLKPEERFI